MRRFIVTLEVTVDVEQSVIDRCLTAEWQSTFYPMRDAEDLAGHLAFNLIQGRPLRSLDGFADLPESSVYVARIDTDDSFEVNS